MNDDTRTALRRTAYAKLNQPAPRRLSLPPDCPPNGRLDDDDSSPAGCLAGIGILILVAAAAWAAIIAAAWMITGWLL